MDIKKLLHKTEYLSGSSHLNGKLHCIEFPFYTLSILLLSTDRARIFVIWFEYTRAISTLNKVHILCLAWFIQRNPNVQKLLNHPNLPMNERAAVKWWEKLTFSYIVDWQTIEMRHHDDNSGGDIDNDDDDDNNILFIGITKQYRFRNRFLHFAHKRCYITKEEGIIGIEIQSTTLIVSFLLLLFHSLNLWQKWIHSIRSNKQARKFSILKWFD